MNGAKVSKFVFVVTLLAVIPAAGQTSSQSNTGASSSSSMSANASGSLDLKDKQFINKAAQGGLAEVELGQLAHRNGSNSAVKDFGQRMVADHTQANNELKSLAQQKGVVPPSVLDANDTSTKDRLSKLQGAEFDKAYMQNMVKDHEKDVAEFRKQAQSAKDPDVRAFAQKTLPTLEKHLEHARSVASQVGASTGASQR